MNTALLAALLVAAANTPGAINIIICHSAKQRVKQTVIWNFRIGSCSFETNSCTVRERFSARFDRSSTGTNSIETSSDS